LSTPWLSILGIGEDGVEGLSASARTLLCTAEIVFGAPRHLELASSQISGERRRWPPGLSGAVPAVLAERGRRTVALASGDPFWFGIGSQLAAAVAPAEFVCIPAVSAFAWACARLGWALQNVATISFCGRPVACLAPLLHPGARILALCADQRTPTEVAALLCAQGFGGSSITVLEALGGAGERHRRQRADAPLPTDIAALNMLALDVRADPGARLISLTPGLDDALFAHDGQITKRELRAVTLAALAPLRGELLWDVGCGSGSVGIEWMLRHNALRAIGIEQRPDRAARAAANAASLGVPGYDVRLGTAPAAFQGLPAPDAIFVGGGAAGTGLLEACWQSLRTGGRLVVNSVTWESEAALIAAWQRHGGSVTRLGIERLGAIGDRHAFRPAITVTQWTAQKP
jgi:precorrin-6Y C5,15-methyltransferase (decarboxylating)